jgi:hypothetical protein
MNLLINISVCIPIKDLGIIIPDSGVTVSGMGVVSLIPNLYPQHKVITVPVIFYLDHFCRS